MRNTSSGSRFHQASLKLMRQLVKELRSLTIRLQSSPN
jgi:hypothetical protein